ncbi:4-hydroxybenzoyl-CoA thioesterase [Rhodococcus sp. 06-156-3C]|uniref:acyl-CoA thioesterase n=1 Tax=Nocardiaceae TaxID=85025 RepID=UPI0009B8FE2F|nr:MULTISPECIES: thioesterase family protein [Rhodococcus]OZD18373.1 4-hydroxybenzoyl-CoA thioesterase [Rhodococcus sp. 06-156-4C]OZD18970.1 4-hydroxybenzoyl-CoA thioesterase [Rhodococcus sp. 06-156-3C]OZD22483.1 4-hydroxybenzoyl-CoA thioesterase [Rhodococcus sp. 06-156-4a]OZD34154.1 4-hydroxybenzoyl-CoA thioesterase [Rhodococcus sp. 06-156-3b]OZD38891.1 4-hydroxybenzoyl-CoA thioesterase [Rhodococcus sp. 06-156-3]
MSALESSGESSAETYSVLWPIDTRWEDNDHYGHVNNVKYYSYFDSAVNAWLISESRADIRKMSAIGVVAETSCRYIRELTFPDRLMVGISLTRLGTRSVTYGLALFRLDDNGNLQAAAIARFVHVYVDRTTRKPTLIPEAIRRVIERHLMQNSA